jgi:phospholipid/cholesterol/gamma-HCH transport system substrate-binding protein
MNASPTKYTRLDLAVGTFVLAGLLALTFLAVRIGAGNSVSSASTTYRASFTNLGGLASGSSVMISGVVVGRVDKVDLDERFHAIATLRVRADLKLSADTTASIRSSGLIGEKFIALSPGGEDVLLKTDELITDTESAVDLESLISRFAFGGVKSPDSSDKK